MNAALSFATAHDRHHSDFHCDEKLATLTAAWEGRTVALQHTREHAGITANERADLEAKAALAAGSAPPRAHSRPH
jgi:ribonuclease HI